MDNGAVQSLAVIAGQCNLQRWLKMLLLSLAVACLFPTTPGFAQERNHQVVYLAESDRVQLNQQVRQQLMDSLPGVTTGNTKVLRYQGEDPGQNLVITLGAGPLHEVRTEYPHARILALFVNREHLSQLRKNQPDISGIFSDPPLERQARLGQLIVPGANRIALLASPDLAKSYSPALRQLKEQGLEARVFVVSHPDRLIRTLSQALAYGDLLLGTTDSAIYNQNTIKHLLLTSYRRNRVLIGPSLPFVRAGAVASSYSNTSHQVEAAVTLLTEYLETGQLPAPRYPKQFAVAVNYQVARSMDLLVPDENTLAHRLRIMEGSADEE